jgi:transcriptional antiterminator NusG
MSVLEKTKTMRWYIVRAQSNKERNVAERITSQSEKGDLMGKVGRVLVPTENTFYMKNGKKVKREKVLYPGYIFVETNAIGELKFWLKGLNGASGFLTNRSGEILPLSETEVNRMIGQQEEQKIEVETPFVIGEEVKIIDGPFSTMLGKIDDINDQKVKLNVSIFGRVTAVELNIIQIDKKTDK